MNERDMPRTRRSRPTGVQVRKDDLIAIIMAIAPTWPRPPLEKKTSRELVDLALCEAKILRRGLSTTVTTIVPAEG